MCERVTHFDLGGIVTRGLGYSTDDRSLLPRYDCVLCLVLLLVCRNCNQFYNYIGRETLFAIAAGSDLGFRLVSREGGFHY